MGKYPVTQAHNGEQSLLSPPVNCELDLDPSTFKGDSPVAEGDLVRGG